MAVLPPLTGTLTSVNLIAAAGLFGNVGGVALGANTALTANISSYTSVNAVSQWNTLVGTGYVTYNTVSNVFPALTNGIPSAYQSNLGSSVTLTSQIIAQSNKILGNGDLGKFDQVLSISDGFVQTYNQFIKSAINANSANAATTFVSSDNTISGGFSDLTEAFPAFGYDLARTGSLIDFENLDLLGSPVTVLTQINAAGYSSLGLNVALVDAGLPVDYLFNFDPDSVTLAEQKQIYQAMTQVTGNELTQILKLLKVTTVGITTLADLVNPAKIFPTSFVTFTTPTANGLRGIYLDSNGTINSLLETQLPPSVLAPLQGNTANSITYDQLRKVIPADQALANKAITSALQQVKSIFNTNGTTLSASIVGLELNKGLPAINDLTSPLPANVSAYFANTFATGTGTDGVFLLTDLIGTPTGWVMNDALSNTTAVLNLLTSNGALDPLLTPNTGLYAVMSNTAAGVYTTFTTTPNPDPPPPDLFEYTVTIPGGLPGAGTYGTYSSAAAAQAAAFNTGLIPYMISTVANINAAYGSLVSTTNTNWNDICAQIVMENTNLANADVDFGNLIPGTQPTGIALGLTSYGVDVVEGGGAFVLESLANLSTQGGQAIVSTMREARNQDRLSAAGVQTTELVSDEIVQPLAPLGSSQYSVAEAASQKII
jgi:hypothetical protein